LASEAVALAEDFESERQQATTPEIAETQPLDAPIKQFGQRIQTLIRSLRPRLFNPGFWLRPGTITALFAVLLITVGLVFSLRRNPSPLEPSATEILQNSGLAEEALSNDRNLVTHRTITLEASLPGAVATGSSTQIIARQRIEIWQSAEKGVTARRLYDDNGVLIAGDWRRADGVQTIYHHGVSPQIQIPNLQAALRSLDIWQLSPSAKDFNSLIGEGATTRVEQRGDVYIISTIPADSSAPSAIKSATLILRRSDLHPIGQTLLITNGNQTYEYRFAETAFERKSNSEVAPAAFEPDKELLSVAAPNNITPAPNSETNPSSVIPRTTPVIASPALEIEVLNLLHQVGADMGEQITVVRAPGGGLSVQGITETDKRKLELLVALSPVANNPAVKIDILTLDEALARQPKASTSSGSISIETAQPSSSALPIEKELRQYLAGRNVSPAQTDEAIRQFSTRTVHRSLGILKHAGALKALAERFSPDELKTLDSEAKAKWLLLVKQHAQAVHEETAMLERELGPVFPGMPSTNVQQTVIGNERELIDAVERLFILCSANDRAISAAFTISPVSRGDAIKSVQFWRSLKSTASLASRIGDITF
jgi:hypothetical protein